MSKPILSKGKQKTLESIYKRNLALFKKMQKIEKKLEDFKIKYREVIPDYVGLEWLGIWLLQGDEKTKKLIYPERSNGICEDCGEEIVWEYHCGC